MTNYEIKPNLKKIMNKLSKKDKKTYEQIISKISEIITSNNINRYKNLRKPLQGLKRVHINGPFVLTFKCMENKIVFYDFDHHDNIYK